MNWEFHLQDPTCPDTVYLFEAIIGAAHEAVSGAGMFAFASRAGVDSLVGDPSIRRFLTRGSLSLVVGIDAVTDRRTLERLRELEGEHTRLSVRVFWNPTGALFHPKVASFTYGDGRQTIIVGSGNLTPGGLRRNFEAFSVIRTAGPCGQASRTPWDRFLADHGEDIRSIDADALERASRNVAYGPRRSRDVPPELTRAAVSEEDHGDPVSAAVASRRGRSRFLVAEVPKAGDRWHQVHFNAAVIEQFFRVKHSTDQRVYLVECRKDGSLGPEEVRPCVYSESNRNHRIEVASHAGKPYPQSGPPVVVFHELQARSFAYMLLMPRDSGYARMRALTKRLPNVGKGLPRVVAAYSDIEDAWRTCPLLRVQ